MYSTKNKKTNSKKLWLVVAIIAVIATVGCGLFILSKNRSTPTSLTKDTTATQQEGKVNLNPVTEQETKQADANKEQIVAKQDTQKAPTDTPTSTPTTANITIVESTSTSFKSYVQGVFEDGGVCTVTATKGSESYTKTSEGFRNVSYTQCAPITWSTPLSKGTWSLSASYKSATAQAAINKEIIIE